MNDLLRDIIEKGEVVVFINDMIIAIETEEGYNKIMEEVLKRMEENYLFMKLEKCM